tara:strand:+ start:1965 stop:2402 length:438 start_codon:yes stop_codon:yes gene_type:complete
MFGILNKFHHGNFRLSRLKYTGTLNFCDSNYNERWLQMPTTLGTKIKELREEKGYTLDKLAELTGSSKSYIWELENKAPPRPSAEKISRIAEKLGVTIEYLMDPEASITVEDASDARFYRKYQQMDEKTKAKIRSFVDLWDDDGQ